MNLRRAIILMLGMITVLSACASFPELDAVTYLDASLIAFKGTVQGGASNNANTCFEECHQASPMETSISRHPNFENQCEVCHIPGEEHRKHTVEESLSLCYSCHTEKSLGFTHPVGEGHIDPRDGSTMTCMSCHVPHVSDQEALLTMDGRGALCVSCHTELLN